MRIVATLLFSLLMAVVAVGSVTMIYPTEKSVSTGGIIEAGPVAPGQTLEIVFSDNSGSEYEWDKIAVPQENLPVPWIVEATETTDTSLVARVKVPRSTKPGDFDLGVILSSSGNAVERETVSVRISVRNGLVSSSITNTGESESAVVGETVLYRARIANASVSPETIRITSNLPASWFGGRTLTVKPKSVVDENLLITPHASGERQFTIKAISLSDGIIVGALSTELDVQPTLKGKFASTLAGFPFFTFSLLPFQALSSLISFLLP